MSSTIKNILIGVVVVGALALAYFFFIKKAPEEPNLSSSSGVTDTSGGTNTSAINAEISKDFISLLLSVRSIKLDDNILSDPSFLSLKDTTITIVQSEPEGRPNPFAPIGAENIVLVSDLPGDNLSEKKESTPKKNTNTPPKEKNKTTNNSNPPLNSNSFSPTSVENNSNQNQNPTDSPIPSGDVNSNLESNTTSDSGNSENQNFNLFDPSNLGDGNFDFNQ